MGLALGTATVVLVVLLWELARPTLKRTVARLRWLWARHRSAGAPVGYDPGRERRAEQRARALLRSCVEDRDWAMYRDLGFLRVWGGAGGGNSAYAYLIYPHKPLVAYMCDSGELLNEYCVAFPDESKPYGSSRLPDADDVLAKWMALTADERGLVGEANMHLPGRQVDPDRVRRDLRRLWRWEQERASAPSRGALTPELTPERPGRPDNLPAA